MCNELLSLASGTTSGNNTTGNNEKITDMIVGASSSNASNTVSKPTTDSIATSVNNTDDDTLEDNSNVSHTTSYSEDSSWSTSTKVLVGLGTAAVVAAAGYGLYKLFSGDDSTEELDVSVEE